MHSILKIFDPITKTWKGVSAIKGETGKSAYQLATEGGYKGTEAQFRTEQANVANNSARLTTVEQNKAGLVDGYVPSNEINPLQGKQTGYIRGEGAKSGYSTTKRLTQSSFTSECMFDLTEATAEYCGFNILGTMGIMVSTKVKTISVAAPTTLGEKYVLTVPITIGQHHVVLSVDDLTKQAQMMLDGKLWSVSRSDIDCSKIGNGIETNALAHSHGAIYHHGRIFNKTLTQQEMLALWNGGHPEAYRIIDKTNLIAEYLPEYLSAAKWIDSSGNGNDLAAIGNVALNYGCRYSGSPMTPLLAACGAVWDSSTGFYELNGLTDITEGEMIVIYNQTNNRLDNFDLTEAMLNSTARTNIIYKPSRGRYMGTLPSSQATFAQCSRMEVVKLVPDNNLFSTANAINMFRNSPKLRRIIGVLLVGVNDNMFLGCSSLEDVKLQGLNRSISLADCAKLTRESIVYLITNTANTTPITVTIHAEAKARLTAEDIALASGKNITIA